MRRFWLFAILLPCLLPLGCADPTPAPQPPVAAPPPRPQPPPIKAEPVVVEEPAPEPDPAPPTPEPLPARVKSAGIVTLPKARVTTGRVFPERTTSAGKWQETTVVEATIELDGSLPENSFYAVLLKNRLGGGIYIDLVGQQSTYEFRRVFTDGFNRKALPIKLTVVGRIPPAQAWTPLGETFQITKPDK